MLNDLAEIITKIILALLLSSLIGIEREIRQKVAGLRTHVLVGIGSTLIVLTSLYVFDIYKESAIVDPTRMIAGIITGVGFICAGTIIRAGSHVRGLTSAATLWVVSGVGIAVGAGHYTAAVVVSIVVFFALVGLRSFERKLGEKFKDISKKED